ncbi:protein ECT2-like [Contarinia nasturtii]|uniref:protein ECT2-like n=1 Tax=Contarinia nasturtii TaxID=265458 RepID=UPI0012D38862|nr:protein ECT2-like [Contarinia nasturtii]
MSGTDYANSHSTGVVTFENGLVGTMKQSVKIIEDQYELEEKENHNELVTNHKLIKEVNIVSPTKSKIMANQMCATKTETISDERICLVGSVADDENILSAARSFNVPVITSKTGIEFIDEKQWTTYYVMSEFDGEHFNAIRKSKHRIYGPTALQQIAQSGKGLVYVNRPLYNFSMKGVITCFTGIRKKDELTRFVTLIHTMGGSIRKDIKNNSHCTHLICSASVGEKYHYAKTFNLTVVRPSWIEAAWERRNDPNFFANESEFCETYKLKSFEGLRICFYGFSPEEHQEMVDILKMNGGIPTDIDDPDCTHLILASNISNFPELLTGPTSPPIIARPPLPSHFCSTSTSNTVCTEKMLPPDGLDQLNLNDKIVQNKLSTNQQTIIETPKKINKHNNIRNDGIVLPGNEENLFSDQANLSPILHNIEEEEEDNPNNDDPNDKDLSKRKRDSFDNISIISTETFATQFSSAKKPKLIRTGSITRSLRRSMSFAALKNPITSMIRVRRNSIDPNASINSITSIESTFSDIKRPVKEKFLLGLKDRITNSSRSKRDFCLTPQTPKKFNTAVLDRVENDDGKFAIPNEISKMSCRKLVNSTMNAAAIVKTSETENTENFTNALDDRTNTTGQSNACSMQITGTDVADNTNVSRPQPISLISSDNQHIELQKNIVPHIVKSDWFWYTIQKGIASEDEHKFNEEYFESLATPGRRESLPPGKKHLKRKRFSILGASSIKRRSSISEGLSVSGSFLDCTNSPSIKHDSKDFDCSMDNTPKTKKQKSMRLNHFMDLYSTENNYVGILHTIVSEFQKPLENMVDTDEELLNKSELRAIFNNFSPIYEVHLHMLNDFKELQSCWTDTCLIGKIILDHRERLLKAYPPYVNFFEQMKDTLQQCIAQNPKFHAFLKINQSKPECGRQTLQDLMIRPVQRLPSMSLLINDILKHTPKSNPDFKVLEEALNAIKDVMKYINEDKRKTEGRVALFDIFNEIDNCPADLVSSHRSYISRCEVSELSNCLSGRDDPLMIFLFTDYIEICKIRKSRGINSIKSPTGTINALNTTTRSHTHGKSYKHIRLIPLSAIPYVYDMKDSERAFAINVKDKIYCFNINEECDKIVYLKNFCRQLAENACRADYEQFLRNCESQELGIDISDINFGTLKKVYNYARSRLVNRAFSFTKTTPLRLKRAVSTTSPLYASTNSLM